MKFLLVFTLVAIGLCNAEKCSEDRTEKCVIGLFVAVLNDNSEEEVCGELKDALDCLKSTVEECVEEPDEELEESLQELEDLFNENCSGNETQREKVDDDNDNNITQCFIENEYYINECIYESTENIVITLIESNEQPSEKALECAMYLEMADCIVERTGEICGERAQKLAREDLEDLPSEIAESCEAANLPS